MEIVIADFVAGAAQARGTVVVIDVFRAFSLACYLIDRGAERIYPAASVDDAFALKKRFPESILIGERHGKKLDGFDYGNSPAETTGVDFTGKTVIHTTHAGTQGLVAAAKGADLLLTGSLVNAKAVARAARAGRASEIWLVRMGHEAVERADEDDACAEYLRALLTDEPYPVEQIRHKLRASPCANRFFDPAQPWSPEEDFWLCTAVDAFDFALRAQVKDGLLSLSPL